jgi:hypothetical protein
MNNVFILHSSFFILHSFYLCKIHAAVAQLVEHQLPKLRAVGSSPICRS